MVDSLSRRLVPDELWEIVQPLIPAVPPRPQGGGTAVTDDRAAIVFVLTSGCAWRHLPIELPLAGPLYGAVRYQSDGSHGGNGFLQASRPRTVSA